jgi:OPA family glycerol-3-phosphate transporter-like MFS transporter
VKAPWFHVRERGTFSTLFGIMIAMGVYFAFDCGQAIVDATRVTPPADLGVLATFARKVLGLGATAADATWWVFFVPAIILAVLWGVLFLFLRDTPAKAGYRDFDTGESSVSRDGERLPVRTVFLKIITHPVLGVICLIEFCSGILRNGTMHWYTFFAKETGFSRVFWVTENWGLSLLLAGIAGSFLTGWASDRFFQSRRGPMAALLYALMLGSTVMMCFTLGAGYWFLGAAVLAISMSVIGVHGILSGTSTADFGGTKNTGSAVGVVDGLVYLGTALQSFAIGRFAPAGDAAKDPGNWLGWPAFLVPFALAGLVLSIRIWSALPRRHGGSVPGTRAVSRAGSPELEPVGSVAD